MGDDYLDLARQELDSDPVTGDPADDRNSILRAIAYALIAAVEQMRAASRRA